MGEVALIREAGVEPDGRDRSIGPGQLMSGPLEPPFQEERA